MELVKVSKVMKKYDKTTILNGLNFSVLENEIVGLIGPSGSGKTTFIKCMIGMEKVNSGQVEILGKSMPNIEVLRNIGYMAQSDALYEELTARENLIFFAKLFKLTKKRMISRIEYAANLVNLTDHLDKKVSNYSGGMKRRLSLAISLLSYPKLLILDEPTVGIDPHLRQTIWKELEELRDRGVSIIITTHVMDEAEKCDRLALIRGGKIISTGSPIQLKEKHHVDTIEGIFLVVGGSN